MSTVEPLHIKNLETNEGVAEGEKGLDIEQVADFDADILVAEDNQVNQEVAKMMLEMLGCRVAQAENGIEAVEMATTGSFDLILMDCQMPEMDGFEASRLIKGLEKNENNSGDRRVKIIAMTGNTTDEDREICLSNGMDDFLKKPFTFDEIHELLGRWLPMENRERVFHEAERTLKTEDSPIDFKYIDNILALRREGAPDILGRVIDHYLTESPHTIQCLNDAVAADDGDVIRSISHKFKSGSANLGASGLADLCWEMERSAGSSSMISNKELLAEIENEYKAVEAALTSVRRGDGK